MEYDVKLILFGGITKVIRFERYSPNENYYLKAVSHRLVLTTGKHTLTII